VESREEQVAGVARVAENVSVADEGGETPQGDAAADEGGEGGETPEGGEGSPGAP
ncbi:MAG: hypothetical protein H6Q88_2262, partial [Anaeromyxobacteraceae bacterium]|nr:hypothetical protein [Anaeromyxobacteraceae bacterium]